MRFTLRWRYKSTHMCTHATLWPLASLLSAHTLSPLCWHKSSWSISPLGLDPPNYPVFILLLFLRLPRPSLSAYQLPFRVGGNACWVMRDSRRTNLSLIALKGHSLTHIYPHLHVYHGTGREIEELDGNGSKEGKNEEGNRESMCVCAVGECKRGGKCQQCVSWARETRQWQQNNVCWVHSETQLLWEHAWVCLSCTREAAAQNTHGLCLTPFWASTRQVSPARCWRSTGGRMA